MYKRNQFNKEAVVKKVFGIAVPVMLGLSLWLDKQSILDKGHCFAAMFKQERAISGKGADYNVRPLLVAKKFESNAPKADKPAPKTDTLNEFDAIKKEPYVASNLPDLVYAARVATPAVVHIKTRYNAKVVKDTLPNPLDQLFKDFFGEGFSINPRGSEKPAQDGAGSGVIYTSNGYIVTNSHVVDGADHIEVNLNDNRCYVAKLVGVDRNTDLALLKIDAANLATLRLGNSDKLEVGEWVLAVGNPLNLTSTVTKGIVSAKSRAISQSIHGWDSITIQSFIQTDAAINPGNSGGALVNAYGELVGINTAIMSRSAQFIGYGFAIPVSLVKKVIDDLIQYGIVQRVLLGVGIQDVDAALAKELNLPKVAGAYIKCIEENSPSVKLLQEKDVITQINGRKINKVSELQEVIGCAKPGDKIAITLYRKGKEKIVELVLEKIPDEIKVVQKDGTLEIEGATFQEMDKKTKEKFKLSVGVFVKEVKKGKFQVAGLKQGYILLSLDEKPVKSIMELSNMVRSKRGPVLLEVMDPKNGSELYLAVDFGGRRKRSRNRDRGQK